MNERIRELQSKSYLMCKQIVDDDGHVVVTPDQWFDKFAELLVRECLEACSRANDIRYFVPPTQEQVVLSCMREIETTFRS